MNLDERLERIGEDLDKLKERHEALTERHEALTQSVEIMVAEGQRLQRLVESHERRLSRLEGPSAA
ncbi:aminoacyltransferase [Acidobacteria bacterium AB60]|nr:aminoacyltransferase [Acidobacteria bacterium AB60]